MALQAAYKQFLAAPNPAALAHDASLHYITTLTTFNDSPNILKHLKSQGHHIKKKEEKFLDVVEGQDALALEAETTLEFVTSGGAYLPGLDDNFIADRTVTFPIIHIVSFNSSGKITQIRQNWDQGSLLKLIDVIGKTGRNWPIRDGKDQAKLIANSVKLAAKPSSSAAAPRTQTGAGVNRSRENSNNPTRDPHASLSLFAPRDPEIQDSLPAVVPPRASAKPAARDFHDLFVAHDSDDSAAANEHDRGRSTSPHKAAIGAIAPKGGAGRNYQPSRLFDNDENSPVRPAAAMEKSYKAHPQKYNHFNFDDGNNDEPPVQATPPKAGSKSKHGATWNFDDFNTPAKHVPGKVQRGGPEVRSWGTDNDEVLDSPVHVQKIDKPRKDADTHFDFIDDGTPEGGKRVIGRPRGAGGNSGMGLYQNNLYDDEVAPSAQATSRPLSDLTNVKERRKDFDPHFELTDDSPAGAKRSDKLPEDRAKAVKMMDANWDTYDQSPAAAQKENAGPGSVGSPSRPGTSKGPLSEATNAGQGINIAGDGMGGRKGNTQKNIDNKRINVGGDGMGGRKGAGRAWGFGDDSDGEDHKTTYQKKQVETTSTGGDFWNF